MNARVNALTQHAAADCFILASGAEHHAHWLAGALAQAGALEQVALEPAAFVQRIAVVNPSLVFVDFTGGNAQAASAAVQAARDALPGLPVVALGTLREPDSALAALRAGVRDFIDLAAPPHDAQAIVRQVIDSIVEPVSRQGRLTVLLGARVGMGVSTLAANLAVLMQRRGAVHRRDALLFDLGLPAGDGTLLLDAQSDFHFVDAVRNLRRFDRTFVHNALSHHAGGLALTTLPPDLADLREVSYAASIGLLNRLRAFFDQQIVDLGGFSNSEFIATVVQSADEAWLVCDQSVASIVSAAQMLDALFRAAPDVERLKSRLRLVIGKYDSGLGLDAQQIAQRLGIEWLANLPERRIALGRAANEGHLLIDAAPRDPYVRALDALAARLEGAGASAAPAAGHGADERARRSDGAHPDASTRDAAQRGTHSAARVLDALRRIIPTSNRRS